MRDATGLKESLKRLAGTVLSILQTRLELLVNEIQEERLHVEKMMLYGSVCLLFFSLSIMLLTVFVVVLFWDSHRLLVTASLAGLFFIGGLLMLGYLRRMTRQRHALLSTSLAELSNDRERLSHRP
ncbi:MAG: phage holin family protein [Gallionella sp.]|nr:phage holin family protein [Gallionella sp.]